MAAIIGASGLLGTGTAVFGYKTGLREAIADQHNSGIGATGECRVARALARAAIPAINDLTVTHRGRSHQMDHIAAAGNALWIIETKTWRGAAEIDPSQPHCQVYRSAGRSYQTINPLWQNDTHCEVIRALTGVPTVSAIASAGNMRLLKGPIAAIKPIPELIAALRQAGPPALAVTAALARLATMQAAPGQARIRLRHIRRIRARSSHSQRLYSLAAASYGVAIIGLYLAITETRLPGAPPWL